MCFEYDFLYIYINKFTKYKIRKRISASKNLTSKQLRLLLLPGESSTKAIFPLGQLIRINK